MAVPLVLPVVQLEEELRAFGVIDAVVASRSFAFSDFAQPVFEGFVVGYAQAVVVVEVEFLEIGEL